MATINEDYVSFETFKLLKEKGFDDSCCRFVIESDETYHRGAPTLQMTMKWLRETKDCEQMLNELQRTANEATTEVIDGKVVYAEPIMGTYISRRNRIELNIVNKL